MAMIATLLCGEVRPALLMAALTHDVGEAYTGDVPYPLKAQHPPLKEYLKNCERLYLINNGLYFPLDEENEEILKAADMLDLLLKCIDEAELGNTSIEPMLHTSIAILRGLQLPGSAQLRLNAILEEVDGR